MSTVAPEPTYAPRPRSSGRGVAIAFGGALAVVGSVLALGGGGIIAVTGTDGKLDSGRHDVSTPTAALISEAAQIDNTNEVTDVLGKSKLGVSAEAKASGPAVFVGVGPTKAVDRYLKGAAVETVTDFDVDPFTLDKMRTEGSVKPRPPATQSFWVTKSTGRTASIDWKIRDGNYRVVVMNADGSRNVGTDTSFSVAVPQLPAISYGMLIIGLIALGSGVALIAVNARR